MRTVRGDSSKCSGCAHRRPSTSAQLVPAGGCLTALPACALSACKFKPSDNVRGRLADRGGVLVGISHNQL
jgi:hypothetical protein